MNLKTEISSTINEKDKSLANVIKIKEEKYKYTHFLKKCAMIIKRNRYKKYKTNKYINLNETEKLQKTTYQYFPNLKQKTLGYL